MGVPWALGVLDRNTLNSTRKVFACGFQIARDIAEARRLPSDVRDACGQNAHTGAQRRNRQPLWGARMGFH